MNFDEKLEELFIDLTEPPEDLGNTVCAFISGKHLMVRGVFPYASGRLQFPGRVGVEVKLDNAKLAARTAAMMVLSYAMRELGGSLGKIRRVMEMTAYVACGADFRDHVRVVDGASELFAQVFGKYGKHARTIAGVSSLPGGASIELSVTFELK
jgi:enamine deaminase RidA (YjgF/YER057c/UK114 family)